MLQPSEFEFGLATFILRRSLAKEHPFALSPKDEMWSCVQKLLFCHFFFMKNQHIQYVSISLHVHDLCCDLKRFESAITEGQKSHWPKYQTNTALAAHFKGGSGAKKNPKHPQNCRHFYSFNSTSASCALEDSATFTHVYIMCIYIHISG